ncbi:hypothetical protein H4Q32_013411 [Labeo rohita]|uniref:Thymus-specific serine protease n=1 Tax=Labeo rohita TaxID=84645 RepID=A0ABQ8M0N5_LABRO|nr:hypothetical protein H4Q32_013411 [Labeo rohita]
MYLEVQIPQLQCWKRFRRSHRYGAQLKSDVEEQWFIQKLDHFNGADTRRYFVNDTFYRPGGPVFLMIGGEGPANPAWMQYGTWQLYAQKLGALCLLLEHRFYGKSHPTEDLSTANLRFLSSRQALADLAHFRTVTAESRGLTNSKWVAFGGSYPGSLAAWFRLKYPQLVHASVATIWISLEVISLSLRLCSKPQIQSETDSAYLLESLAENFMDVVQYNEDNRAFEGAVGTNITIKVLCSVMLDSSLGEPYDRYAAVVRLMLNTFSQPCLNTQYKSYIQDMSNTSWSGPEAGGGRQWVYQTCTEFGFYQSTDSPNQPFSGFPLPYYLKQCADIYNLSTSLDEVVQQTNEEYGGYDIKSTRIVFPNGSIDPWHALGVTQDITSDLPAVFIKGTAHCANMYPARAEDLPQLGLAWDHIFILLQKWLAE